MIRDNQYIIHVMDGDAIVYLKSGQQKQIVNAGFSNKKIVITTERLLIFESLANRIQQTEYELTAVMAKKPMKSSQLPERKPRISVCQLPQVELDIQGLESKVIIDQEPAIYKFMQKQNIQNLSKDIVGMVLLKQPKVMKYYMVHAGSVHGAIRLAKAIICSQAWKKYNGFCNQMKVEVNPLWVRVLTEIIGNDESVVLVDPDLFATGSQNQIQTFVFLTAMIPFAHCYHYRFNINTSQSAQIASSFITPIEAKAHSLSFRETNMSSQCLKVVIAKATLPNLFRLDLSGNNFNDEVFDVLNRVLKAGAKRLAYLNLSRNMINLSNPQLLVGFLKVCQTILNLDLSYNLIDDSSTETIEKYIIFALNPPLEEVVLSYNKFSRKTAWRLFVGNLRNFDSHPYMKFILYPIPIKKDIFGVYEFDFPRHNTTMNLNMHSALVEQFQQESFLKHTFQDIPATALNSLTINFKRVLGSNVLLPNNRQDLNKTLQISHEIQNFIYASQSVQKIYAMAVKLTNFPFEVPPISRARFIKFLYQKFNQALFIRDHYSVKYLLKALMDLDAQVDGYTDRMNKLKQRNIIYRKRAENIMNFEMDELNINEELDELVKEGLRLYLEGHGVELIYYLKYKRDQYIEKYLEEKLNPQHYLYDLMAKKNISVQQHVSEKEFVVPYEIRLEKKINEHFYLHPWQANYQILSQMKHSTFDACLEFLEESDKKQKFSVYFDRIEERIEFIKNQFTYFSFNKFKASYSDLKINACRLLFLYNNIKDTNIYLQIPNYVKKRNVTQQKMAVILNKEWFRRQYHIINYVNINLKARKANFYDYNGVISRYGNEIFLNEVKKVLLILNEMLRRIQIGVSTRQPLAKAIPEIVGYFKMIVDTVRHSLVPEELKEELYLHLISWRKGRFGSNTEILHLLPAFTMYLKPPLQIQKFLVGAILQNENVYLTDIPLCLATNPNEPTSDNVFLLESQFVERDWIPSDKVFVELFQKKGKVTFDVQMLDKTTITVTVGQSRTVAELMVVLVDSIEMTAEDKQHFWLYKLSKETQDIIPYESREHVGQILADYDPKESILLLKRRLHSRLLKYNFQRYGQSMINSLYHDVKYEYLCRNFFVNQKLACEIASILFMIQNAENMLNEVSDHKNNMKNNLEEQTLSQMLVNKQKQLETTFLNYIPLKVYKRSMKSKEVIVAELRAKISERILKCEYNNIYQMKLNLLTIFSKYPEFASTNYQASSKDKSPMKISVNYMFMSVQHSQECEIIHLEKLVSILPKHRYLLIYYHKQENLVAQLPVFGEEKLMFALAMDILSYCSLRIKMSSINLYEIYNLEATEIKIATLEQSLRKIYDKGNQRDLQKCKEDYQAGYKKVSKMSLTLMLFKQLQYYNKNNYIKSYVNRKLYANKSERKLNYDREYDEEEQQEINAANQKIMEMLFPKLEMEEEEDEPEEEQYINRRLIDNQDSMDYRKEYEKLNLETTEKKEKGREGQYQPRTPNSQLRTPKREVERQTEEKTIPIKRGAPKEEEIVPSQLKPTQQRQPQTQPRQPRANQNSHLPQPYRQEEYQRPETQMSPAASTPYPLQGNQKDSNPPKRKPGRRPGRHRNNNR